MAVGSKGRDSGAPVQICTRELVQLPTPVVLGHLLGDGETNCEACSYSSGSELSLSTLPMKDLP